MTHVPEAASFQAPTMAEAVRAGGLAGVAWLLETPWWRALRIEGAIAAADDARMGLLCPGATTRPGEDSPSTSRRQR